MKLAVGQVYAHAETGQEVVVIELRGENHPRGLGKGYGISAITAPCELNQVGLPLRPQLQVHLVHPFDVDIICDQLPSHGTDRWKLVTGYHYELIPGIPNFAMMLRNGPYPTRGDE